ncbi:MAG: protein kinase [Candidatus Accumulibacter sp.]|nr:protein kinase [Accumulibacter sp.]
MYLVHHQATSRLWALKQMKDLNEAELNKRFERGMRLHKDLAHRNIMRCFETGLDAQGQPYVVTEYVGGGELGAAVDGGTRLRPDIAVPLIGSVLDGLEYLHGRQIIHRDIKPPNILLDRALLDARGAVVRPLPSPKIADFDLAKCYGLARAAHASPSSTRQWAH